MNENHLPDEDVLQLVFGELELEHETAVRKALEEDPELAATAREFEVAVEALRAESIGHPDEQFNDRLLRRMSDVLDHAQTETTRPFVPRSLTKWRWIMRSPVSQVAAAAIFVLAVTGFALWFPGGGTTPAYADFLAPILEAKTVTYKLITEMNGPSPSTATTEVKMLDANRSRSEMEVELPDQSKFLTVYVRDRSQRKTLMLQPSQKRATVYSYDMPEDMKVTPDDPLWFHSLLLDARERPGVKREPLGEKEIDGRRVTGVRISLPAAVFSVWGDPNTGLPARIEATVAIMPNVKMTMSDFKFDASLDESLFSVEPPTGYEVIQVQRSLNDESPSGEQDLIELFRYYGELSGGRFPDLLDLQWLSETVRMQRWLAGHLAESQKTATKRNEEEADAQARLQRGMKFIAGLSKDADSYYAGRGVSLGTDTPVFWYRPTDATKYRIVFADLSVHEANTPPSVPATSATHLENDLIEMLRQYCELSDRSFPPSLDEGSFLSIVLMKKLALDSLEETPVVDAKQEPKLLEALITLHRGLIFNDLLPRDANAHYTGKGVSLGATETPVFWYRPNDAKTFRVVYADLSVRDAETPPATPDTQPEDDLIDALRHYCELSGGPLPDLLDLQTMTAMIARALTLRMFLELASVEGEQNEQRKHKIAELVHKLGSEQTDKIDEQLFDLLDWEKLTPGKGKLSREQMTKIIETETQKFMKAQMSKIAAATTRFQQGLSFTTQLSPEAEAHYAGKGVSLGAADTPIFWYRVNGATEYRVIYGDLSVREADVRPNVPDAQPTPTTSGPKK